MKRLDGMLIFRTNLLCKGLFTRVFLAALLSTASVGSMTGCRMGVPIHVWQPPSLHSTVGKSVMVPKLVGEKSLAEPLHEKLLAAVPRDTGRRTQLVSAETLPQQVGASNDSLIALVSYDPDDESDLALATAARQEGIDFILRGEILPARGANARGKDKQRLAVSWRLMPVGAPHCVAHQASGRPVVVELESAVKRYPDLAFAADPDAALQAALIRDTLPLITPSVQRGRVQLEISYVTPGSRDLRRGNQFAVSGRWPEAEQAWDGVLEKYPFSSAAVHNLAIAAVARQDFSSARRLISKAVRLKPSKLHKQTLVWVERSQRDYHIAFELPAPPEGWSVTR